VECLSLPLADSYSITRSQWIDHFIIRVMDFVNRDNLSVGEFQKECVVLHTFDSCYLTIDDSNLFIAILGNHDPKSNIKRECVKIVVQLGTKKRCFVLK